NSATPTVPSSVCWVAAAARYAKPPWRHRPPPWGHRPNVGAPAARLGCGQGPERATRLAPVRRLPSDCGVLPEGEARLVMGPASLVSVAQDASETEPPS